MPRPKASSSAHCSHDKLIYEPCRHAQDAGYTRPTETKRIAACLPSGRIPNAKPSKGGKAAASEAEIPQAPSPGTFPAPLVLPGDDISSDPRYPAQSLRSWSIGKDRNPVTLERGTIYVAAAPGVFGNTAEEIKEWTRPIKRRHHNDRYKPLERLEKTPETTRPEVNDVMDYLSAFYHGIPVKQLDMGLSFTTWTSSSSKKERSTGLKNRIGINTGSELIGIRTRPHHPFDVDAVFTTQLNLNDLLDAALAILPADAYALLMLVDHDIYEDEDEEFTCGRAYGGSRIAVVSTARYNPVLDVQEGVETEHAWPASHCAAYAEKCCANAESEQATSNSKKKRKITSTSADDGASPSSRSGGNQTALQAAVSAFNSTKPNPRDLYTLYLSRVCRTTAHELGHCFGIDHCMYYACCMQGTAGLSEDARQPPYLCPVDSEKVVRATGSSERKRNVAMLEFCEKWKKERMFSAYAAWIRKRLEEMERDAVGQVDTMDVEE